REPEMLAQHQAEAGELEIAIVLYERAGNRAGARSAFREARAHLGRALALLPALPDDAARRLEPGLRIALGNVAVAVDGLGAAEQQSRSLAALGVSHYLLGRYDVGRRLLEEALACPGAYDTSAADVSGGGLAGHFLVRLLAGLGEAELTARATEVLEAARNAGHFHSLANVLCGCCT